MGGWPVLIDATSPTASLSGTLKQTIHDNMPGLESDDVAKEEKLKAALWYSVGQIVDSVAIVDDLNATPHFIGGLSEMLYSQIERVAQDLEAFAKHAGRSTINAKDVLLLGRHNDSLQELLSAQAKSARQIDAPPNGR